MIFLIPFIFDIILLRMLLLGRRLEKVHHVRQRTGPVSVGENAAAAWTGVDES